MLELKHRKLLFHIYYALFICLIVSDGKAQWTALNSTPNINQPFRQIGGGTSDKQGNVYALLSSTVQQSKNYLAKWDGIAWSEVANSWTSQKYEQFLCVFPDNQGSIYTTCLIDNYTPNSRLGLVKWDGLNWTEIISFNWSTYGSDGYLPLVDMQHCIDNNGHLYFVITKFKTPYTHSVTDTLIQTLYKWDNSNLTILYQSKKPSNVNFEILDIKCDSQGNLYAGGCFKNTQGYTLVKWNGSVWMEQFGSNHLSTQYPITNICIDNKDNIFTVAKGCSVSNTQVNGFYIAQWDGFKWNDLDPSNKLDINPCIDGIAVDSTGNFYISSASIDNQYYYIHKWNKNDWFKIIFPICNFNTTKPCGNADLLCFDKHQDLVAQGNYINTNGDFYIAKYKNTQYVSINENSIKKSAFSIYPNPTNHKINFNLGDANIQKFNLIVSNTLGQVLIEKSNTDLAEALDVSHLTQGIYFIQIQNKDFKQSFKVVKE